MLRQLYSQAGQDLWVIRDVFGYMTGGYFVDIGAADGVELSNSLALERYFKWDGLCIEANPKSFEKLAATRKCRKVQTCLDATHGEVRFTVDGGFFGGIVAEDTDNTDSRSGIVTVPAVPLHEVFEKQNVPTTIHYLSVDVEGAEERVLAGFPFETHRFLCATIERPSPALRERLQQAGYLLVAEIPNLDAFYLHPSMATSYNVRARISGEVSALPLSQRVLREWNEFTHRGLRASLRRF